MKTILVIEDHDQMRKNLVTILSMEGYAVLEAADGMTGLGLAQDEKPDLVVCDVSMPDVDGHEVLRSMRADRSISGTPFIFLTARGKRDDQRAGMNLGADDYLVKPVEADDLLASIEARLSREMVRTKALKPDFTSPVPLEQLGLSSREAQVLLWVAQGKSNSEIAMILGVATGTIKVHLRHLFQKLGADNRHALAMMALERLSLR